jgi:maltooligosyltrehalose trehalohydrolase
LPVTGEGRPGAIPVPGGVTFRAWAPAAAKVTLHLESQAGSRDLEPDGRGYHQCSVPGLEAGARYHYALDGGPLLADPASRSQPDGVHGPSEVVDLTAHVWGDADYRPCSLRDHVISEVHIGTFTQAGTFDAAIERLDDLAAVGISAVEIMPVAQFPGARNWGYDGVFPFAAQDTYGGAAGLQRLVDACHQRGLAAILDVVYNHLGPEGNVLDRFGPYFTERYRTPWGAAVNLDGPDSDEVRAFFIANACQWLEDFRFDGLRLDAVHEFIDRTATPFLVDLSRSVDQLAARIERPLFLIAESADNDPRLTTAIDRGGLGMSAQWSDDFHHAVHAVLTGERSGYYVDYGTSEQVVAAMADDFVYTGQHSAFRNRRHGAPVGDLLCDRFVHFAQNHDQIGNRSGSERLSALVPIEHVRLAAALLLLSPGVPLLFMGDEYGDTAPFPYFVDHTDRDLLQAVRQGRAEEFPDTGQAGARYDPADPASFNVAHPDVSLRHKGDHQDLLALYARLIELRRSTPALQQAERSAVSATAEGPLVTMLRQHWSDVVVAFFNLSDSPVEGLLPADNPATWSLLVGSGEPESGLGTPGVPAVAAGGNRIDIPGWGFCAYQHETGRRT